MNKKRENGGKLGFLDRLGPLFRLKDEGPASHTEAEPSRFDKLAADFDSALQRLNDKIEEQRRAAELTTGAAAPQKQTREERAAEKARRIEACHQAMREDIEAMHAQLGTGLSGGDLTGLAEYLKELDATTAGGGGSHSLLPRARHAITERLRIEAGELAVTRLIGLLERANKTWPDPMHYHPAATEEAIERSRRRRLAEIRESFLTSSLARTAERMLGVVKNWGGDYPERDTPLWQECVLEAVAAGIRAQLLKDFVELMRRDRDLLLARVEASVGQELAALQSTLAGGVRSIEQASQAVAGALRVLDEIAPEVAWEHVRSQLPQAQAGLRD